jgi:hypothetical protein
MISDPTLCRVLYEETRSGFRIEVFMTRFGGFAVFVFPEGISADMDPAWDGTNVLQARAWVDLNTQVRAA